MSIRFVSHRSTILLLIAALAFSLAGAAAESEIRRDRYGIPHILAATEAEAAMAHGFAAAEDHFTLLSRLFLRARAQQARYFGEQYLQEDLQIHRLGIRKVAQDRFSTLQPSMQAMLNGYARGYNRYLATRRDAPEWATPISGIDVLAHCRALLLLDLALDLRQIGNATAIEAPKGSNLWAIGKGRTASGRGILLVNPHLSWFPPLVFYEVHLTVPGRVNIYGAAFLGAPVVGIGFNQTLGWGHTINSIDADDLYRLEPDPSDPDRYLYDGESLPLHKENVEIEVRTNAGLQRRAFPVLRSHHGPALRTGRGDLYAFKSANLDLVDFLGQWAGMARAHDLGEFRAALNQQALPMMNVGYSDREGNVFYLFNGRIPQRPPGHDWSGIVPGNTSLTEWSVITPVAELPQLLNPATGYIQNCNNPPWFTNLAAPIDGSRFAHLRQASEPDMRTQFSLSMLEKLPKATLADVLARKHDYTLFLAQRLKPELVKVLRANASADPVVAEAASVLERWDNRAAQSSRGGDLFVNWWLVYAKVAKPLFAKPWNPAAPLATPSGIGQTELAVAAMAEAAKRMKAEGLSLDVAWGDTHRLRRGSLDLPLGGASQNYGAFRTLLYAKDKDGKWRAAAGDTFTFAVEFTDHPVAWAISAYSQSSEPGNAHFADQSELFAKGQFRSVWFRESDVLANTTRRYGLPKADTE